MKTLLAAFTAALFLVTSQSALAFSIKLSSIKKPAVASIVVLNETDTQTEALPNQIVSSSSSTQEVNIGAISITSATIEGDLIPVGLTLTPGSNTDLTSGAIDSVLTSTDFSVSTLSAITGSLDPESESITLDIDPWILSDNNNNVTQNLGGTATGSWDGDNFSATWTSYIQIPWIDFNGEESKAVTWTLNGSASGVNPIPVPAAVWLFGSGLMGLVGVARRRATV